MAPQRHPSSYSTAAAYRRRSLPETPGRYVAAAASRHYPAAMDPRCNGCCRICGAYHGSVPASCLCSMDSSCRGGDGDGDVTALSSSMSCTVTHTESHTKKTRCKQRYRKDTRPPPLTLLCADEILQAYCVLGSE